MYTYVCIILQSDEAYRLAQSVPKFPRSVLMVVSHKAKKSSVNAANNHANNHHNIIYGVLST